MCRSIKRLRNPGTPPSTAEEIRAAARQFVRKVSGFQKPSAGNSAAFEQAIADITAATQLLLDRLPEARPPRAQPTTPVETFSGSEPPIG